MSKLIILLVLVTSSAFAHERKVLLEKKAVSGYVLPEHSFKKDCAIFSNGDVEVVIQTHDSGSGFTAKLPKRKVFMIRQLIRVARNYPVVEGPILCDAGTKIVNGYRGGKKVLITEEIDCGHQKNRRGWPAQRLRKIAEKVCGF